MVSLLTPARRAVLACLSPSLLWLGGCATDPKAALPALQQAVTSRGGPPVAWPQSRDEQASVERSVDALLEGELTAQKAVQVSVLNNRTLRATLEELGLSQADLVEASRLRNPTFGASVRWPNHSPRGPNVEFSLATDLIEGLLIPLRKKIAGEQLAQSGQRVAHEVMRLAAETESAFYTVQAHQQFRERLAALVEVNAAGAELAQRQFDAGNINELELAHQQVTLQLTRLEFIRAEAQMQADRENLNRRLGLAGVRLGWKISSALPALPDSDPALSDLEDRGMRQRLDLSAAKTQVSLAQQALDLKRQTRLLPASVNLGVDTEREPSGDRLTGPSVELGLPIFDQGQVELARLGAQLRRATALAEGLENDVRSEVREAHAALVSARTVAEFYASSLLPGRTRVLRETLLHYNAMQKSNYELLTAREQQLATERDGVEARLAYWIARVQLERALGGQLEPASPAAQD